MRFGRYRRNGSTRPFFLTNDGSAYDWEHLDKSRLPEPLRQLVRTACATEGSPAFLEALPQIEKLIREHPSWTDSASRLEIEFGGGTPVPSPVVPHSIICVGLNYRDHAAESGMKLPESPLLFAKTANTLSGHGEAIKRPSNCEQLDFEAELAVVIGRDCHSVSSADAMNYVAGYTCANDVSARDFQFADGQWFRGKSADGFAPIGPWIVTTASIADPQKLRIQCRVNGAVMQDSNTANLIFSVPKLIEYISRSITLVAGDVVLTGTPPGVGFARKPPVYLQPGDNVEVEIEQIGILKNVIG